VNDQNDRDLRQFERDLDRHGAALSGWPAPAAADAAILLARSEAARRRLREAERREIHLRRDPVCPTAAALDRVRRHVMARLDERRESWASVAQVLMLRPAMAVMAASVVIGLVTGIILHPRPSAASLFSLLDATELPL
jgi:hypothetical protein